MSHFKDCIGAIDDTHIVTILPPNEQIPDIGRKGKYYLVGSRYPQMKGYLGPYRGQRYHLHDFRRGRPISVASMAIYNFIRKHVSRNDADFMEYENINRIYENIIYPEDVHDGESDDGDDDDESNNLSGFEMELTRDTIASSLINLF
ncbi:hypothetical protein Gotur_034163 [Gossypium turneri]